MICILTLIYDTQLRSASWQNWPFKDLITTSHAKLCKLIALCSNIQMLELYLLEGRITAVIKITSASLRMINARACYVPDISKLSAVIAADAKTS